MIKSMCFSEINPFIRHVRIVSLQPYDRFVVDVKAADYRLIYVCKGKGTIAVENTCAGETIRNTVLPGDLLIWKPGLEYSMYTHKGGSLQMLAVSFDFTYGYSDITIPIPQRNKERFSDDSITELINFTDADFLNYPLYLKKMHGFESVLFEMLDEFKMKKKYSDNIIGGLFKHLLGNIARIRENIYISPGKKNHKVDLIIQYLYEYGCHRKITYEDLGRLFNFHPNYINKLILTNTGKSLHQYLLMLRITHAANLLHTSDLSISEIAEMSGFNEANHFARQFKSKTGKTPSDYRKDWK